MTTPHLPPGMPTLEVADDLDVDAFEETQQDLREDPVGEDTDRASTAAASVAAAGAVAVADPEAPPRAKRTKARATERPATRRAAKKRRDGTPAESQASPDVTADGQAAATAVALADPTPVGAPDGTVVTLPHWMGFVRRVPREPYLTAIVVGAVVFTVLLAIVTANGLADAAEDRDAAAAELAETIDATVEAQDQIARLQAAGALLAADGAAVANQAEAVVASSGDVVELLGDVRETFEERGASSYNARLSAIDDEVGELNDAIDEFDVALQDLADTLQARVDEGSATSIEQQLLAAIESLEVRVGVVLERIG